MELFMTPVDLVWLVPALPLAAMLIIFFGTRMAEIAARPRPAAVPAPAGHGGHGFADAAATPDTEAGHEATEHATDDHGAAAAGGHGEHGGHTPFWPMLSSIIGVGALLLSFLLSLAILWQFLDVNGDVFHTQSRHLLEKGMDLHLYNWFTIGSLNYSIDLRVDTLTVVMLVVVTGVSFLVHLYSVGYMAGDPGYSRFYIELALFTVSMLILVLAANFLVLFIGWELVGLSSYLLIGFWFYHAPPPRGSEVPYPPPAALKAFVTTRLGDFGFLIGILILFTATGTFNFIELNTKTQAMDKGLLTLAMILVFCGAVGKSAQFPLHVWLPDAMAGPTPVSALIHAATMVAAGVYLVARTYLLFAAAYPAAFQVVAWVGAITAIFAASIALVQNDFKRVLAFSTISQLGYMFVGLGVAGTALGPGPGMFHLFTHAFFKALLFLGAGSVLHALHHATHREVQDMRLMGGLASRMPITAITWLIATLAISGFPGFSGFFSKEFIIGRALEQGQIAIYVLTLLTAGMTAFYMLRAFILAFGGKGGSLGGLWGGSYRGVGEPHESPLTVTLPLIILAIFAVVAGYWTGFFSYVDPGVKNLDYGALLSAPDTWIGVVVALVGLVTAFVMYARVEPAKLDALVQGNAFLRTVHRILYNRYYVDDLYNWIIRYIVLGISHIEQAFDTYVIDGLVNGVARAITGAGDGLRQVETGRVQSYMIGFFGGVAALAVLVFVLVTFVK